VVRLERFPRAVARVLEKFDGKVSFQGKMSIVVELSAFLVFLFVPAFVLSADEETGAYDGCKGLSESAEVQSKKEKHRIVKSLH